MTADVRREESKLRRAFARALWLAAVAPVAAVACSAGSDPGEASGASSGQGAASSSSSSAGEGSSGGEIGDGGPDVVEPGDAGDPEAACAPTLYMPNPPDLCGNYVRLPCGLPKGVVPSSDCYLLLSDCQAICPSLFFNCHAIEPYCVDGGIVANPRSGEIDIDCSTCAGGAGRVPEGLLPARTRRAPSAIGDYFAAASHLEDASVHAFRRLRGELRAHRAPVRLLRAARRAERDEVRHARVTGKIARRFGGAPVPARVDEPQTRPLSAVAMENAIEGCVRETFGALVASYQAVNAKDPEIARAMAAIARDETRHAALSWAVARWAFGKLDRGARAEIEGRCREAIADLGRGSDGAVDEDLARRAGLPGAEQRRALALALEEDLWARLRS